MHYHIYGKEFSQSKTPNFERTTIWMFAGVAFIQDTKLFSPAPKEFREVLKPRDKELVSERFAHLERVVYCKRKGVMQ
ncbi:hypothetical protein CSX02_00290 [Agathobacter ruminis]|uniref:Uncharacterized protein n=1 Tax=Agathobacter ruminis TaxID=1712665 RepID=A0A2G3E747_9FIRM|nr:hypothetical protein CSX02_00290 [Agathobacter ruminis]